jgi:SAM-dependent methyltransferase
MNSPQSLDPSYFEALYAAEPDPWKFATSAYETQKYATTIAALPNQRYHSAFEIGGSIGVLTSQLAPHCEALLSIDVSPRAQTQAIQRCQALPQVRFQIMQFPDEYPEAQFDLIILSEVGYYWSLNDLKTAQSRIIDCLEPGGHLLLVHWRPVSPGYPLTGDQVHDSFLELSPTPLQHILAQPDPNYRLDLFRK